MDYKKAIELFKKKIKKLYGNKLHDIILYGSTARGDQDSESDIDILIVLKDYKDYWKEVHKIEEIEYAINSYFDFNILISAIPVKLKDYRNKKVPLYINVKREGISV